jgi:hypothetical protein
MDGPEDMVVTKWIWGIMIFAVCIGRIGSVRADTVVVFNEIMYHPPDQETTGEWVELHNQLSLDVDISGWSVGGGIDFVFPEGTILPAEGFLVVAASPLSLVKEMQITNVVGPFSGKLSNSGETLVLLNNSGRIMDEVGYEDHEPWPVAPGGSGVSLAKRHEDLAAADPAHWTWSQQVGGTPGRSNFPDRSTLSRALVFNEVQPAGDGTFWLEIMNVSEQPFSLSGCVLVSSDEIGHNYVLPDVTLPSGSFQVLDSNRLGFTPASGDKLFLFPPARTSVEAAILIPDRSQARYPDGDGPWRSALNPTPGQTNQATFHDEIVINEILYHVSPNRPDPNEPAPSWIELYNRSDHAVDLTGWRFEDGVTYAFEPNTILAPDAYLVVASDAGVLRSQYPGIRIVGDFGRQLSHRDDRLLLVDREGLPADEVHYYDYGYWPAYADGGGSSLELTDPRADNASPQAWAASDETGRAGWTQVTCRGVAAPYPGSNVPTVWNEFVFGLLDAGEFLIDDIRVVESPDGTALSLIQQGTFESGMTSWRLLGNHGFGSIVEDPENSANHVLLLKATGALGHNHNHVETTLAGNRAVVNGREYEVSFRARWLAGSNQLNTRLYFNRLAKTTLLPMSAHPGTPGARNSRYRGNIGPTYSGLIHAPVVPEANQDVTVTCTLSDPDGVQGASLWYAVDNGAFTAVTMRPSRASVYAGTIPGQKAGAVVQFYVTSHDRLGQQAYAPADGPDSRAMFQVQDGKAKAAPDHTIRVLMSQKDAQWMHQEVNQLSNHRLGATLIYNERDVYYDVKVRFKGSGYGRQDVRVGFSVRFRPDQLFQGVHEIIDLDRNLAESGRHRELVFKHLANHAGGLPSVYDDMTQMIAPFHNMDGPAQVFLARYDEAYLDSVYTGGSDMTLFELEIIYYSTRTVDGKPESLKRRPDTVLDMDFGDMGPDKEAYRWNYQIKSHREKDDYSDLMAMARTFSLTGDAFARQIGQVINVDEWMRLFACQSLGAIADTYNVSHPHNLKLYVRPDDHKIEALPWDTDRSFANSATSSIYGSSGSKLQKILALPAYRRLFLGHMYDIMNTTFRTEYLSPWIAYYATHAEANVTSTIESLVKNRRAYALSQLPAETPFAILSATGNGDQTLTLTGQAWIDVTQVRLQGRPEALDLVWTDTTHWSATVTPPSGVQAITLEAYGRKGQFLGSSTRAIP